MRRKRGFKVAYHILSGIRDPAPFPAVLKGK